jgi:transposase
MTQRVTVPHWPEPFSRTSPHRTRLVGLGAEPPARYPDKDNNKAERQIRGPVVTRKNVGGSRNGDSARNAAVIWTVTATAQMAGLNIFTYLIAYLDECGRNSGKPLTGPALERFLPWSASPEDLRTWAQPPPPG